MKKVAHITTNAKEKFFTKVTIFKSPIKDYFNLSKNPMYYDKIIIFFLKINQVKNKKKYRQYRSVFINNAKNDKKCIFSHFLFWQNLKINII